jgi:hypothetical protein
MPVELSLAIVLALTFASLATALRLTAIGFKLRV